MKKLCTALLTFFATVPAWAACPDDAAVARYLGEFKAATPSPGFGDIALADAPCARGKLVAALPAVLGQRVGYKAVFTNVDSQKRFGVDGPAWGAMFAGMMLESGARLPAKFGVKPRHEPDFVVVVKDAGLADARTPREALAHLSALVPFIELPDLMLDGKITGPGLIATNAAFRGGVLGARIPAEPTQALADAMASMEVVITETRAGKEIAREKGSVLMDNPLNAAIWLAQALRRDGVELRPGDLLSLGGFKGSMPTAPGTTIEVRYHGLPGDPAVTVHFD
ncbi:MAG: hydratase [Pseudomonadota bacterium]